MGKRRANKAHNMPHRKAERQRSAAERQLRRLERDGKSDTPLAIELASLIMRLRPVVHDED